MNGISQALSRLPAARALIAGAAILAGAASPAAHAKESWPELEDMALSVPRVAPQGLSGVALPRPLSPSEALRVRRIFAHQARQDIPAAMAEAAQVSDPLLLGHILADRYLRAGPADMPGAEPLSDWLLRYADLPDAPAVHSLLLSLLPKGAAAPPAPPALTAPAAPSVGLPDEADASDRLVKRNPVLDRSVLEPARAGQADRAVRLIVRTRGLDPLYGALLRAEVAQILFTQGRDAEALALAEAAHRQARGQVALAPFVAGLAAWRLDRAETAGPLFAAAFEAPLTSANRRAAAAFWAARAQLRSRNAADYAPWLQRAAEHPGVFYGLLARRALGWGPGEQAVFTGLLGEADVEAIDDTDAGHRAFALLQVGQPERAAAELRRLWSSKRDKPGFSRSILLVAQAAGLDGLAVQLGALLQPERPELRLPAARLAPSGGFRIDPALMYAMTRLESNFDPAAVSPAGARGLMQIMPLTAESVVRDGGRAARGPPRLHDPATNLDLGQRYLLQLAQYDGIGSDLIRLLASYNSGPGSFARWGAAIRHLGDPLLFIESVPLDETRAYIPRVLAYTWLYAARLKLPTPSLDELAAGTWPRFTPPGARIVARLH